MDILSVDKVYKDFKGLEVLNGVTFTIQEGERHAVIGPNGAGKTTLFNIISGKFRPSSGSVKFRGKEISGRPPHTRCRLGISRSFQITNVFQNLSVFENVRAGVRCRHGLRYNLIRRPDRHREINDKTNAILEQVGLQSESRTPVRELSYGQQRALEIAVTLSTEPQLILLDEPTAGMTREETAEAIKLIDKITRNRSLIIIEHDMDVVFSLAETVSVLHYGSILVSGKPEEIRTDQRVKDAYLGDEN